MYDQDQIGTGEVMMNDTVTPAHSGTRRLVSLDRLMTIGTLITEDVMTPEVGPEEFLRVKCLSEDETAKWRASLTITDPRTGRTKMREDFDSTLYLFFLGTINLDGERYFPSLEQARQFAKLPISGPLVNRCATVISRLSGINEDPAQKEERKEDLEAI